MAAQQELKKDPYERGMEMGMKFGYNNATHDICNHIISIIIAHNDNSIHFQDKVKLDSIRSYVEMLIGKN